MREFSFFACFSSKIIKCRISYVREQKVITGIFGDIAKVIKNVFNTIFVLRKVENIT